MLAAHAEEAPLAVEERLLALSEAVDPPMRPAGERVVMLGDFNAEVQSEPLRLLLAEQADGGPGLTDAVPAEAHGTFHNWTGGRDGPRIDFILAGPGWKVSSSRIRVDPGPPYPSDHYPVAAVLGDP